MKPNMMGIPRTLLLVNSPPGGSGIGEIFLRDLAKHCPPGSLARYSTVQTGRHRWPPNWCGVPSGVSKISHSRLPFVTSLSLSRFVKEGKEQLAQTIAAFARFHETEQLWIVLTSGFTIALSERLVAILGLPYVVTVQDMPEYMAINQGWGQRVQKTILESFDGLLSGARGVGAASHPMARMLAERYGQDPVVQIHGIHPSLFKPATSRREGREEFVVAFAGSLYSKHEWNALLRAIEMMGARMNEKRIVVKFIGRFPLLGARRASFVQEHGVQSLEDTLLMLREADLAYLPYWFDERFSLITRSSFPNKLSAYLAAGLPTLFHGPADASPVEFYKRYPVGPMCHSLDPYRIAEALRSVEDATFLQRTASARQAALKEELNLEIFVTRFARLLGVERGALLPLCDQETSI